MSGVKKVRQFRKKGNAAGEEDMPASTEPTAAPAASPAPVPTPTITPIVIDDDILPAKPKVIKKDTTKPAPIKSETKSTSAPAKATMLSFDDEDGDDEFQVKKTSRSKKMAKEQQERKLRPFQRDTTPIVSTATMASSSTVGEYTPEKLNALRKNAISLASTKSVPSLPSDTKNSATVSLIHNDDDVDTTSNYPFATEPDIPSAAQILAAKNSRTRAREGKDDGYISLDSHEDGSRLVREDGDDDVPDEFDDFEKKRVTFGLGKDTEKEKQKYIDLADDSGAEDEDDEMRRWELEQIRKGGGTTQAAAAALHKSKADKRAALPPQTLDVTLEQMNLRRPKVTMDTITRDIRAHIKIMEDRHSANKTAFVRVEHDLNEAQTKMASFDKDLKTSADQYKFFQTMKGYVSDLIDCLEAKAPEIEECEERLSAAEKARATARRFKIAQKQQQGQKAMQQICDQMGTNPQAASAYKNNDRRGDAGWSSDEESTPETAKAFADEKAAVNSNAKEIFEDVDEEFNNIAAVSSKFEKWKSLFNATYKQAFVSMSVPHVFAPFVRLELLNWAPLERTSPLANMNWFLILIDYGIKGDGDDADLANDPDLNLVPNIAERVLLPRVRTLLSDVWDPSSLSQTRKAKNIMQDLLSVISANANQMKDTFTTIIISLQGAVDNYTLPQFPFGLRENTQNTFPPFQFSMRYFYRGVKLIQNIGTWQDIITPDPLIQLVADKMINDKLLPFMKNVKDTITLLSMCEKLLDNIPKDWLVGHGVSPAFGILHDFVKRLPKRVKDLPGNYSKDDVKKAMERAVKLLIRLNDTETARKLIKENMLTISM